MQNSMLLITSSWNGKKTFRMIPVTPECIYNEAIYDIDQKVLAVVGKEKKETFHMLPKLTELGDLQVLKIGKRQNGKDYAEERKLMESFYEYYVEEPAEIENFIKLFAINADSYNFKDVMAEQSKIAPVKTSDIITV